MNLSCNCDMPIEIYADWLQDQGWDVDELRSEEEAVFDSHTLANKYGLFYDPDQTMGSGYGVAGRYGDANIIQPTGCQSLLGYGQYLRRPPNGCGHSFGYYYPDHH